ncbi:MAG: 2-C-methyl-D-erythritol 4-phosphate cytidylyltransferase [Phycisphaerales bacterium]|nr:MAG: 2-C-methyl-D-erythritol 4-phosphate cytidylyltransferase [Phycisphaerales bacterium]
MHVCTIIPAAGRSSRFGTADKLAQDFGGRPLLVRTVEVFTKRDEVTSIIVAGPPEGFDDFRNRYGATLGFHGAKLVEGGRADRWETVQRALEHVPEDATHVAVHDAARPGPDGKMLDRLFEAATKLPAVVPALPIGSTVKRVSDGVTEIGPGEEDAVADLILGDAGKVKIQARAVIETVDRSGLMEVQTPQVFEVDLIRRAYAREDLHQAGATDDASLVEQLGETVHVIDGDPNNLKITTPEDLKLMRAVLGVKPPKERPVHKRF